MNDALRDRYRGVMVGLAAGDALGATVEFVSRERIREQIGVHREITGGGWLNLPAGEVTDDTQMALCIARSLADLGRFDPADIGARFVDWFRSRPPDIGNTTRHALEQLDSGVAWDVAGERTHQQLKPRTASNGSVMRCAPVALYARGDTTLLRSASVDSSHITHANPLCTDACAALNAAIAALLDEPEADSLAVAIDAAQHETVRQALRAATTATRDDLRSGGYVLDTLGSALWCVARHDSLESAVVEAVNLGDDADTTGAVAGAIAGARCGFSAIPSRWLAVLRGVDEFVALADRLLELSVTRGR